MNQVALAHKSGIDRDSLVAWMIAAIDHAEGLSRDRLIRRVIAPAGLPVELLVDDARLAEIYFARLGSGSPASFAAQDRIYILTGETSALAAPLWQDINCDAKAFQAAAAKAGFRAAYPLIPRFWQFFDTKRRVGIQIARHAADRPKWDTGAPLRLYLHWLLAGNGSRLVHGASLGLDGRGVLILGKGGAGKSATTLAGLAAGLVTTGDDYVALDMRASPSVRLLYRIVKQNREGLDRVANLRGMLANRVPNWQGKIEFDPVDFFPGAMAERLGLVAILLPRIAHAARPTIAPTAPASAMLALMSTNLHQHIGEAETGMAFFGDMLRRLPCFSIELAQDAAANGEALRGLLQTLPK